MKKKIILSFAFFSLLFLACTNQEEEQQRRHEPYDTHPVWTDSNPDAFWDK